MEIEKRYKTEKYQKEEEKMLEDCLNWDNEKEALIEAFKRGIEIANKILKD